MLRQPRRYLFPPLAVRQPERTGSIFKLVEATSASTVSLLELAKINKKIVSSWSSKLARIANFAASVGLVIFSRRFRLGDSLLKIFWICLLISVGVPVHAQNAPKASNPAPPRVSIAAFGLAYPLSNDWVRATELLRTRVAAESSTPTFDVLLAAVYVPKSTISGTSPFFSLRAYRQPATNCKKSLENMIASSQDQKDKPEGSVAEFSAAGRDYFRLNLAHGLGGRHQCVICTTAEGHLLIWEAHAPNEKGLDVIVATLDSITPLPPRSAAESAQSSKPKDGTAEEVPTKPVPALPQRVRVSEGVSVGLLVKKVTPFYPAEARAAYIQGTVVLQAEISKTGDITDLELVSGPVELAGSAVAAIRQWKYKPYLLMGRPVAVETQIQVNYQLTR
jgi:TonB family protein